VTPSPSSAPLEAPRRPGSNQRSWRDRFDHLTPINAPGRIARPLLWLAGLVVGILSIWLANANPGFSFAGGSLPAAIAELAAGWSAIAVGLMSWGRRPGSLFGPLLMAAGFTWFLVEWMNPQGGSSILFTAGLLLSAACPPLVAHAVLVYPNGRLRSDLERLIVGMAYVVNIGILGLVPTLFFDPTAQHCAVCPSNLLMVAANESVTDGASRVGLWLALVWALLAILLAARSLLRATVAGRRVTAPVRLAGIAFLGLFAADVLHSLHRGIMSNDNVDVGLWFGQAAALAAISAGVALDWMRARQTRGEVARLVIELSQSSPAGGLRTVLAQMFADPGLQVAYPIDDGRLVDADGRAIALGGPPDRTSTPVVRGGEVLAVLGHRPDLLDESARVDAVVGAARLALASERLQAESRTQVEDLSASRARIVEAGDVARRRLERDLHDGAQQRLVSISLDLRRLQGRFSVDTPPAVAAAIEHAEVELRTALEELRELAHGIFPAILADEGLAAGIEALAEGSTIPIQLLALPIERVDPRVEAAAYFVVAEALGSGRASRASVSARLGEASLAVEIEVSGPLPESLVDLEDQVGAAGGTLNITQTAGGQLTMRALFPLAVSEAGAPT
jgi:signal transduction histidine kinase